MKKTNNNATTREQALKLVSDFVGLRLKNTPNSE